MMNKSRKNSNKTVLFRKKEKDKIKERHADGGENKQYFSLSPFHG